MSRARLAERSQGGGPAGGTLIISQAARFLAFAACRSCSVQRLKNRCTAAEAWGKPFAAHCEILVETLTDSQEITNMGEWILIVTIVAGTYSSPAVTQVGPFATRELCMQAANAWLQQRGEPGTKKNALCAPQSVTLT